MPKGKWYLLYTEFDNLENRDAKYEEKVRLAAGTEENAVAEAQARWRVRSAKPSYQGWDGQTYPQNPRLVYELEIPWPMEA